MSLRNRQKKKSRSDRGPERCVWWLARSHSLERKEGGEGWHWPNRTRTGLKIRGNTNLVEKWIQIWSFCFKLLSFFIEEIKRGTSVSVYSIYGGGMILEILSEVVDLQKYTSDFFPSFNAIIFYHEIDWKHIANKVKSRNLGNYSPTGDCLKKLHARQQCY